MVFVLTTTQSQHSRAIDAAFIPMLPIGLALLLQRFAPYVKAAIGDDGPEAA
jgi:hypothetical protein